MEGDRTGRLSRRCALRRTAALGLGATLAFAGDQTVVLVVGAGIVERANPAPTSSG